MTCARGAVQTTRAAVTHECFYSRPWITHQAAFEDMIGVFPSWTQPETGVIKAVVSVD